MDATILQAASTDSRPDFEDAVQVASALALGLDAIVTRNGGDFAGAPLPVYAPADLLRRLPAP